PLIPSDYDVTVGVGDPGWASTYTINVNGVNFWTDLALSKGGFQETTRVIHVSDAKIAIDQGLAADRVTRIDYVEIRPASNPPAGPRVSIGPAAADAFEQD